MGSPANRNVVVVVSRMKNSNQAPRLICKSTLDCIGGGCRACLYKAFPRGVSSISDDSVRQSLNDVQYPSNVRPENCLRAKDPTYNGLQSMKRRILIVGDGDFSFSLSVARSDARRAKKHLIASSYESEATLLSIYTNAAANIAALRDIGVQVLFCVDAMDLMKTPALHDQRFDVIAFNFPCICVDRGADGQATELEQNRTLVKTFFNSAKGCLEDHGEVHVSHKTIEPFSWWGLTDLANTEGYRLVFDVVFDKYNYPGYTNRKALDKKSFTCNDAKTFVFVKSVDSKSDEEFIERYSGRIAPFVEREIIELATRAGMMGSTRPVRSSFVKGRGVGAPSDTADDDLPVNKKIRFS